MSGVERAADPGTEPSSSDGGSLRARPTLPRANSAILLAVAGAFAAAFAALAAEVREDRTPGIDRAILRALPHYHQQPLHDIADLVLNVGGDDFTPLPFFFVAAITIVLVMRGRRVEALFLVLAAAVAAVVSALVKPLFPRPSLHFGPETGSYFPSGHAMGSFAVVAALVLLNWHREHRVALLAAGGVFVIVYGVALAFSREHYPTDVLAGWCLGAAWILVLWLCFGAGAQRSIGFRSGRRDGRRT
jgi:undecaprenyl-diphosphatase